MEHFTTTIALVGMVVVVASLLSGLLERSRLPILAEKGLANPWVRTNPRKIERVEQLVELLEAAW